MERLGLTSISKLGARRACWLCAAALAFLNAAPDAMNDAAVARAQETMPAGQQVEADNAQSRPASMRDDPRARRLRAQLFWATLLVVILIASSIAIIRFSRRYRAWLVKDRKAPTHADDVWAMHKPPSELLSDEDDEPLDPGDADAEGPDRPAD